MAYARRLTAQSVILGAAAILALTAPPAAAHHGWSTYTLNDVEVTGTVKELRFGNPHDRLTLEVDGEDWDIWLAPPSRNRQNGFTEEVIQVGDTVTIYGDRNPDRLEVKTEKLTVNGDEFLIYPERLASR